jgi:uncharacterized membrane protein YdjX (TVP38/TMEM64 family)
MKKLLVLGIFVAIILGLYLLTPASDYLSAAGFAQLEQWIQSQGMWAPVLFALIYITATIFALPGSALTIGGGLLFGTVWGTVINLVGATIGACAAFVIARYLGRGVVTKLVRGQQTLGGLDEKIGRNGFYSVLVLRLVPLFPFNALNYGLGLTKVSLRDYALASVLGMLPGSFVYTSLGAVGRHVDFRDLATWTDYHVWGPFVLVMGLSLIPTLVKKLKTRRY